LDNHRLAEMEFYLVDELECDLTVYHPYRSLMTLCGKETDEVVAGTSMTTQPAIPEEREAGELGGHGVTDLARYAGSGAGKLLLDDRTLQLAW
jgi:cyclin C